MFSIWPLLLSHQRRELAHLGFQRGMHVPKGCLCSHKHCSPWSPHVCRSIRCCHTSSYTPVSYIQVLIWQRILQKHTRCDEFSLKVKIIIQLISRCLCYLHIYWAERHTWVFRRACSKGCLCSHINSPSGLHMCAAYWFIYCYCHSHLRVQNTNIIFSCYFLIWREV